MQSYSIEQLSVIIGVSVVSVEEWIDGNRFVGITRETQEQINDLTLLYIVTGELISVGEVQRLYEKNQERLK